MAPCRAKILLQGQHLPPEAQGTLGQEPDLGHTVDHDPRGLELLDALEDGARRLAELQVGRIEQALLLAGVEHALERERLEHVDSGQRPAVADGHELELLDRLGQGDIEAPLASQCPFEQELEAHGRLAGPRRALDEIGVVTHEAANQHLIQPGDAGGGPAVAPVHVILSTASAGTTAGRADNDPGK